MRAPRPRRRWLWLLLPALLLLAGWGVLRALLEPARLSDYLLRQAQAATGLEFTLAAPARIAFWPDLHLELEGLQARAPGAAAPLLEVARLEAVLPWSSLRAERVELRSLRLQSPRLELPALRAWLDARSVLGPPAPLRLPALDAALTVHDGRIAAEGWRAERIELRLDGLRAGAPTALALEGDWSGAQAQQRFALRLTGTPREQRGALAIETLRLQLEAPLALELRGRVEWQPPQRLAFALEGELPGWPADWPASPLAPQAGAAPHELALGYEGSADLQGRLRLRLARGEDEVSGELRSGDLAAWLGDPARAALPPLQGRLAAGRLQIGTTILEGVQLQLGAPEAAEAEQAADGTDGGF